MISKDEIIIVVMFAVVIFLVVIFIVALSYRLLIEAPADLSEIKAFCEKNNMIVGTFYPLSSEGTCLQVQGERVIREHTVKKLNDKLYLWEGDDG